MTEEELKLFVKDVREFMDHTNKNFSQIFKDRENDHNLLGEVFKAVGGTKSEVQLLNNNVSEASSAIKTNTNEVKKTVDGAVSEIKEELGQKKIVHLPPKPRWFDKFFKKSNRKEDKK